MRLEPAQGFNASMEADVRVVKFKVAIDSHTIITSTDRDSYVLGDSSNTLSSSFTTSSALTTKVFSVFLSRDSGTDSDIDVRILGDNAGSPDTGNVIGSSFLLNFNNTRPDWYDIEFESALVLSASTKYWIELSFTGNTNVRWYKDSTATGFDYAVNATVTNDETLIFKIRDINSQNNEFELEEFVEYQLNPTEKYQNDAATIILDNSDKKYNEGQPKRHLLKSGTRMSFYIGNDTTYLKMRTLQINDFKFQKNQISIILYGPHVKLIKQDVIFKTSYIGMDYSDVIIDLLEQADIPAGNPLYADNGLLADDGLFADTGTLNIERTGINFPANGTLEGSIADAISKIEQVTNFKFSYDSDGNAVFKRNKISLTSTVNENFIFSENDHILDRRINVNDSVKNMFNRIIINNGRVKITENLVLEIDKFTPSVSQTVFTLSNTPANSDNVQVYLNGQKLQPPEDYNITGDDINMTLSYTLNSNYIVEAYYDISASTADSQSGDIDIESSTLIQNYSGTINSSTKSIEIIHYYTEKPILLAELRNNEKDDSEVLEVQRSTDFILFKVFNKNYPNSSGDYSVDIFGSQISNSSDDLLLIEKSKPLSLKNNGIIDYRITNNLFVDKSNMNQRADTLLFFNSGPREFFTLNTTGYPVLENGDIVKIIHEDINPDFLYKIVAMNISCKSSPRSLRISYDLEKFPIKDGQSFTDFYQYADSGLLADDGLKADAELFSELNIYQ